MKANQGEIVEVNFYLPDHGFKPHPCLIVSGREINEYEDFYIVCMLSTTTRIDEFSYPLEEWMLTHKPKKKGQVRCHLIAMVSKNDILNKFGRIKKKYLTEIINQIKFSVFKLE